ncbi:hypothetical protein [Kitasatospora sp. NPDC088548]|uniref:hypothetical protein n=1 Tax=Kitasatospora sp. NPDC088548 TaxID=3364075 RepID=UPI0037F52385
MAEHPVGTGLFVVIEAADGSGKTAVTDHLVPLLASTGRTVHRIDRAWSDGDGPHAELVRAVNALFRSEAATAAGWEVLSLAAATQYATILRSQIEPAVRAGDIVIAESWWDKTRARLSLEATIALDLDSEQHRALTAWQSHLLPPSPLPVDQHLTVLVDAARHDRVAWYRAAGCPDPYLDRTGPDSHDPDGFGHFTEHIADQLRQVAAERAWPTVTNGGHRTVAEAATELHLLITDQLSPSTRPAPEAP